MRGSDGGRVETVSAGCTALRAFVRQCNPAYVRLGAKWSQIRIAAIYWPSSSQPAPARTVGKGVECRDDLWRAPDAAAWTRAGFDDDACPRQGFEVSARVLRLDAQLLGQQCRI